MLFLALATTTWLVSTVLAFEGVAPTICADADANADAEREQSPCRDRCQAIKILEAGARVIS